MGSLAKTAPPVDRDRTFTGRVVIDDRRFENCTFNGATLIYFGGPPPSFQGCRFDGAAWDFKSSAANTLQLLRYFSQPQTGFRGLFDQFFTPPDEVGG